MFQIGCHLSASRGFLAMGRDAIKIGDVILEITTDKLTNEVVSDGQIHLRIDYKVSGLGSGSCGPQLEPQFRLSEKEISFGFRIQPK